MARHRIDDVISLRCMQIPLYVLIVGIVIVLGVIASEDGIQAVWENLQVTVPMAVCGAPIVLSILGSVIGWLCRRK